MDTLGGPQELTSGLTTLLPSVSEAPELPERRAERRRPDRL
jgi:hypothetical protein